MRIILATTLCVLALCAPVKASDTDSSASPGFAASAYRIAISEVAILRYRAQLNLTAAQQKYWPAAASALRRLAREPQVNEAAARRLVSSVSPLYATLDPSQKQTAMSIAQKVGLAQYASLL